MIKTLRQLVDELGKTVIVVIHEISFATQYFDHIIAIKDGEIVCHKETGQVMLAQKLNDIFGIDFDIIARQSKNSYTIST